MLGLHLLADQSSSAAYETGQTIGGGFIVLLLSVGIAKTISIMRRPRTSSLCASALLTLLAAWLLSSLTRLVGLLLELPAWLKFTSAVLSMLLLLATMVLAVAGLILWRLRREHYNQGKAQAIWALILSGGAAVLMVVAFVRQTVASSAKDEVSSVPLKMKTTREYLAHNFRLGVPDRPWTSVDPSTILEGALAVYTRGIPESYCTVVAEKNGSGLNGDNLKTLLLARIESAATSTERLPESTRTLSGLTFLRIPLKLTGLNGLRVPLYYEFWIACSTDHAYTISFWCPWRSRDQLVADAELWMRTFALTAPATDAAGQTPFTDHEAPGEGYATRLAPLGWRNDTPDEFPEARLVATLNDEYLVLVDMPVPEWSKARPQDIDDAMLEMLNLQDSERPEAPESADHHGLTARVYRFERSLGAHPLAFRARVLQAGGRAWLLVTWGLKSNPPEPRELAAQAVRLFAPPAGAAVQELPPRLAKAQGHFLNNLGIAHHRRQEYRQAELHFREALRLQPEDAAIAMNIVDALENQARPADALRVLTEEASADIRNTPKARAKRAELLALAGKPDAALDEWKKLFDDGQATEDHLLARINLLLETDRPADALEAVSRYAESHPSPKVERWHAAVLAKNDCFDEALAKLEPRTTAAPPDVEALYLKGELENEAGRYEAAEQSAASLLAAGEDTARTHLIHGWSEWHRKSWKAAHEAFSKAAGKAPEDAAIKEALAMTAGALGQGSSDVSLTPLDPVAVPPEMLDALSRRGAPTDALVKGHGAFYHHRLLGVFYRPGEPVRVTHYYKVTILDQRGLEAFSGFSQTFHPAAETVFVNRLVVTDADGSVIQEGTNADAFTTGEAGDLATGARVLQVPVPGLRKGCTVDVVITVQDKSKSTTPPLRRDLFAGSFPAMARGWFFTGDSSGVRFTHAPSIQPLPAASARAFVTYDTPAYRREAFMAPLEQWQPWIVAGPSDGDWKKVASDYLKRIRDRLKDDASTKDLADRLCRGLTTPEEKLGTIVRHVQSSLTYKGLEFGTRALIPSPVGKILADQYGDCKDHTLLLYHLLRRAGITCQPALVDTGWQIRRDIPSLDQFDHMILYVPGTGSQPWIDATSDWLDLTRFAPESLGGRDALVLDPAGARFEKIPQPPATVIRIAREAAIREGGALEVKETLTLSGAAAAWARAWFMSAPATEHANLIHRQLDAYGQFNLTSAELTDAEHIDKPLQVRMQYVVGEAFDDDTRQLNLPFYWELDYLGVSPMENRRSPLSLSPAMEVESVTRITGLPGPGSLAQPSPVRGRNPTGTWELTADGAAAHTVVSFRSRTSQGDQPAAVWPEFQNDRRAMTEHLRRPLQVTP